MIDYEKLKKAHELAERFGKNSCIEIRLFSDPYEVVCFLSYDPNERQEYYSDVLNIDQLIAKLQELTKSQPMYKNAWYLINNEIRCTVVHDKDGYQFCDKSAAEALGRVMYPTKQALIEAQIEYWTCLKNEEKSTPCACNHPELASAGQVFKKCDFCEKCAWFDECQHESDGMIYYSNPPKNKCKKCREFYK